MLMSEAFLSSLNFFAKWRRYYSVNDYKIQLQL